MDTHNYPAGSDTLKAPWYGSDRRCPECVNREVESAFSSLLEDYVCTLVRYRDGKPVAATIPDDWKGTLWLLQDAATADCYRNDLCSQHAPRREED
jgi:hypothetical protein